MAVPYLDLTTDDPCYRGSSTLQGATVITQERGDKNRLGQRWQDGRTRAKAEDKD